MSDNAENQANVEKPSAMSERVRQVKILMRKNWILIKRNKRSTILQLLVPFLFVLLLYVFQFAIESNNGFQRFFSKTDDSFRVGIANIPRCVKGPGKSECFTIAWTTNNDTADAIVRKIAANNNIPESELKKFTSSKEMDDYMKNNPNITQGGYVINMDYNLTTKANPILKYAVQYNQSAIVIRNTRIDPFEYLLLPYQNEMEKELFKFAVKDNNAAVDVDMLEFPHPELVSSDVVGTRGAGFFFGALMFNVVIQLGQIVSENENKLREGMNLMGLKDSVFWFTWWATNTIMNTLSVMVLIVSGWIFNFDFFTKNDFGTYFMVFFLFGLSMVPLVFLLSVFITRARTATSIGFVVYLIGTIIQGFAGLAFNEDFDAALRVVFSFLPFVLLAKGITDLAAATADPDDVGLRWSEITDNEWFSLEDVYTWYIIDFFVFFALAIYLDNVWPKQYGTPKKAWYFLTKDYWMGPDTSNVSVDELVKQTLEDEDDIDDDVREERDNVRANKLENNAVRVVNLVKTYRSYKYFVIPDTSKDFTAVHGINLSIPKGQLLCLLGHNGAGKTTTISMLTGMFGPTAGTAFILGNSITTNMDDIRRVMGVCPQHDILWDQLSGREHLELFAAFKGLEGPAHAMAVEEGLGSVGLTKKGKAYVSSYSGGEKRRLSTAIALIGDPQIVFLDEPTTGMDPVSRRDVWNLIESSKRDRVIVLTTHSMEEADILGDRIVIMSKGRLSCIGTSLHLKNKFGAGYSMTVLAKEESMEDIKTFFKENLDGIEPFSTNMGLLDYNIDRPKLPKLPDFFQQLESNKQQLGIENVQISMTTLEEVFLTISHLNHDKGKANE